MYFFNVNKTPDKALVAACIINQEKCVNELTSISGRPKLYDWKPIRSALLEGWVVCLNQSIWWVKHRLCRLALCGSWHTPPFLQHALAHSPCGLRDEPCASPHTTDRSSADAGGGARFAEAFWQGPSLLYSQSPKLVEYLSYSTSIPHIKSLNSQSSLHTAAWLPGCTLGRAGQVPGCFSRRGHSSNSACKFWSFAGKFSTVCEKTTGKILNY